MARISPLYYDKFCSIAFALHKNSDVRRLSEDLWMDLENLSRHTFGALSYLKKHQAHPAASEARQQIEELLVETWNRFHELDMTSIDVRTMNDICYNFMVAQYTLRLLVSDGSDGE